MDKEILRGLADNPALFDAVKKLLLDKFALDHINTNSWDATDEALGQSVRAKLEGKRAVEIAFAEIAAYRSVKPPPQGENPAR